MILNTGVRTDTIQYFTPWLLKRFEEGYVLSRNPMFQQKVTRYELTPEKVDCVVFCSKNYKPIQESNLCFQSQNLMCYHYTNRLKFGRSGSNARQCAYQAHTLPSEIHPRADNWAWTSGLLITNQLRYQLRHAGNLTWKPRFKMTVRFGLTIAELQSAALNHLRRHQKYGV